jgi:Mg2+ and Co2+ transporter CorA
LANTGVQYTEKQERYIKLIDRFNKAKKEGFYFESLWIIYAILEDRTDAIFIVLNIAEYKDTKLIPNENKEIELREILHLPKMKITSWFTTLYEKTNRIKKLITILEEEKPESNIRSELILKFNIVENLKQYEDILSNLDNWRKSRNKLMHELMQPTTLYDQHVCRVLTTEGELIFRQLNYLIEQLRGNVENIQLAKKRLEKLLQ